MATGNNKSKTTPPPRSISSLRNFVDKELGGNKDKNSDEEKNDETVNSAEVGKKVSLSEQNSTQKVEKILQEPEQKQEEVTDIETLFRYVNQRKYEKEPGVYVDGQIRELLADLKKYTGVNTGNLVSFILENWIEENMEAIKEVLEAKRRKNRFLD